MADVLIPFSIHYKKKQMARSHMLSAQLVLSVPLKQGQTSKDPMAPLEFFIFVAQKSRIQSVRQHENNLVLGALPSC